MGFFKSEKVVKKDNFIEFTNAILSKKLLAQDSNLEPSG